MKTWTNAYFKKHLTTENLDITDSLGVPELTPETNVEVPTDIQDQAYEQQLAEDSGNADSLVNIASSLESIASTLAVDGMITQTKVYNKWVGTVLSQEGISASDVPSLFSVGNESISLESVLDKIKGFFVAAYEAIVKFLKTIGEYFKKAYEWIMSKFSALKDKVAKKKEDLKKNPAKNAPGHNDVADEILRKHKEQMAEFHKKEEEIVSKYGSKDGVQKEVGDKFDELLKKHDHGTDFTFSKEDSSVGVRYRLVLSSSLVQHIQVYGGIDPKKGEELTELAERCQKAIEGIYGHIKNDPLSHIRNAIESLHSSLNAIKQHSGNETEDRLFDKFEDSIRSAASSLGIHKDQSLLEIYQTLKSEQLERANKHSEPIDIRSRDLSEAMDKIVEMVTKDLGICSMSSDIQNKMIESVRKLADTAKFDALESEGLHGDTHAKRISLFKSVFERVNQTKNALMIGQLYYTRISKLYNVMTELAVVEPVAA